MRRNATRVAAAVLTLAVTMTSVNLPISAAAAKKTRNWKFNKNDRKISITKGDTVTITVTKSGKKVKAKFTSKKPKIVKITSQKKKGVLKIKALKAGKSTIVAKYGKKTYKCIVTVKKKKTTKPSASTKPSTSTAPSTSTTPSASGTPAASEAPGTSTAPTGTPAASETPGASTAPTATPAVSATPAALGIASATAKAVNKIEVTLTAPLPDGATFKVVRDGSSSEEKITQAVTDTEKKVIELTKSESSAFAAGTYTVTLTADGKEYTAPVTFQKQEITSLEILNKEKAYTSENKEEIYVYYAAKDQYGQEMNQKASINWVTSVGNQDNIKDDKKSGCLTITKSSSDKVFKYGELVHISGYDSTGRARCDKALTVDLERAIAEIDFRGFIDTKLEANESNILDTLPADFAKGRYRLLYTVKDQEGHEMKADTYVVPSSGNAKVSFNVDRPMIVNPIDTKTEDLDKVYSVTLKDNSVKDYCSILVEPGQSVDQGGEVTFTAISNATGRSSSKKFKIDAGQILQSLTLRDPGDLKDGDQDKPIPYEATAKDKDGNIINNVTNYETIVRSTNKLNLNASIGTLKVKQKDDGTAEILWSDESDTKSFNNENSVLTIDGRARTISLSANVVGGTGSGYTQVQVSDARYPASIDSVKLKDNDNNILIKGSSAKVAFGGDNPTVVYKDQYGDTMDKDIVKSFFEASKARKFNDTYAIAIDEGNGDDNIKYEKDLSDFTVNSNTTATTKNIQYSIVKTSDKDGADKDKKWSAVESEKNVSYTIVPIEDLSNFEFNDIKKVRITTKYTEYLNGKEIGNNGNRVATEAAITESDKREVSIVGYHNSKKVTIPKEYIELNNDNSTLKATAKSDDSFKYEITSVATSGSVAIKYDDLYDFNDVLINRKKDAKASISFNILNSSGSVKETIKTRVAITDAKLSLGEMKFKDDKKTLTLHAKNTKFDFTLPTDISEGKKSTNEEIEITKDGIKIDGNELIVYDDCGNIMPVSKYANKLEFTIKNLKENSAEYSHVPNSFKYAKNGSGETNIDMAEIGDKFDLTISISGTSGSLTLPVTMGADKNANVNSKNFDEAKTSDNGGLRGVLGYNR